MPSEAVIERMIVQLIGDGRQYRQMLVEARQLTSSYTTRIGGLWRNAAGQMITSQKKMQAELFVSREATIKSAMAMRVFGQEVARAGRSMSMYLTAPLLAMGTAAIKFGSDFETGFAGVRRTVEASEPEFAILNTQFRELAATIPVSAEELLRIGEIAGQLGIKNQDIIGFTRTIAELAATSNLTIENGAESMARFANIVQMSQDKFHNLGSAIVSLGVSMAASEEDITEMSMRIGAAGTVVGLTIPEILSLAASLSSIGIKSEMGGSAISRMMIQVSRDIATGSETIDRFAQISGMKTEEFKEAWRKNVGHTILTFLSGLESLDAEASAVALEELGLDGIRLHQTMLGAANAVDMFAEAMDKASVEFEKNTSLTEMAEERFKTFASTVTILYNQIKLLGTEVFEVVRPALISIVGSIETLTKSMRSWSAETKGMIIVAGGIVASLGPLLLISGSLVAAVGQLRLAFIFVKPALLAVFGVPGLGQILAIVSVLVLAFQNWEEALVVLDPIITSLKDVFSSLILTFEDLSAAGGELMSLFGPLLAESLKTSVLLLTTVVYMIKEVVDNARDSLNTMMDLYEFTTGLEIQGRNIKVGQMSGGGALAGLAAKGAGEAGKVKAPSVTPIDPAGAFEKESMKEYKKAIENVDQMKAKFDDELAQMQMSESDYLFYQLSKEKEKGVSDDDLNEILDAYDKLQEVKKKAAAIEKEEKTQKGIYDEIQALKDQRRELELGERAFMAFEMARKGANREQVIAALGIYDEIQALEKLEEQQEEDEKAAKKAKEAHDKFRDSIQRTVQATGRGLDAIMAREEAKAKRPEDPKNLKEEKEKQKQENMKQGQLAEKAYAQGAKIYDVLKNIEENTTNATGSGPIVMAEANIGQ